MSLTIPPQPDRHPPSLLTREWQHWLTMPMLPFSLLLLSTLLVFVLNPLLPIVAYMVWQWAAGSWAWRDRWTSIWTWAKQGTTFVALVLLIGSLSTAHVWLFPALTDMLQAWWHAHLIGDLSLWPINRDSLFARTLLLLPLAPALALVNEWIDPRTTVQPQRILLSTDREELKREQEPPQELSSPSLATSAPKPSTPSSSAGTEKPRIRQKKKQEPPQQRTIDSFLTAETSSPPPSSPSTPTQTPQPEPPSTSPSSPSTAHFDWNDVAE
jgi:hypothetical protein